MSKKSYKRLQNRLYREIKARIIAENSIKIVVRERKTETIRIANRIPFYAKEDKGIIEYTNEYMAKEMGIKLLQVGFIKTNAEIEPDGTVILQQSLDVALKEG